MSDKRTVFQKRVDETVGPPLYYCDHCKLAVKVSADGGIERPCEGPCDKPVIAPRRAIAAGAGGLNLTNKTKMAAFKLAAGLTGRCV